MVDARKCDSITLLHQKVPQGDPRFDIFKRILKNRITVASFAVFFTICMVCILAPYLTRFHYTAANLKNMRAAPSRTHILGTDALGRDIFSRLLYGGRVTLRIAFLSTVISTIIGGIVGLVAGYFGRRVDFIISPVLDALATIPVLLLAVVFELVFDWGYGYFMYAIALAAIPHFARIARASVMNVKGNEYIQAARALGVSQYGILTRHILHNVAPPLIVRFTAGIAEALLTCTFVGYLGIGIRPPTPEWGMLVYEARGGIMRNPLAILAPCAFISLCVVSISLFGDGLRDVFHPKS